MKVKILITFALDMEFAPWRGLREFSKIPADGLGIYESKLNGTEARVLLTGVGFANARQAARAALEWRPDICISSGLAGSLRKEIEIAQVCAAREVVELETGRKTIADPELLSIAETQKAAIIEKLLTSAEMVLSTQGKSRLGKMAEAVEMESFAVMNEAAGLGIPSIAIRAISDAADENLPMDFGKVLDENGTVQVSKVAREIARAPHKVPAVIRLARRSSAASKRLAEFLDGYVPELAAARRYSGEMAGAKRA